MDEFQIRRSHLHVRVDDFPYIFSVLVPRWATADSVCIGPVVSFIEGIRINVHI